MIGLWKDFFETSVPNIVGGERTIFPLTKHNYVVPCTLMIKILPNLDEGIKIVGFIKEIESNGNAEFDVDEQVHYILYGGENNAVFGITESCYKSFGIPVSLIYGIGDASGSN